MQGETTQRPLSKRIKWRFEQAQLRLTRPVVRFALRRRPVDPNYGFNRGRPIDRYYIESFLSRQSDAIQGQVLEIEHDLYTRTFGGSRVRRSDILHVDPTFPGATITADLTDGHGIESSRFDCVIVTQTLHCIYDVAKAVRTTHRILKPGGSVLATVPCVARLDMPPGAAAWGEYWRFTSMGIERLFGDVFGRANVQVQAYGNLTVSLAGLAGLAVEDLTAEEVDHCDPLHEFLIAVRAEKDL